MWKAPASMPSRVLLREDDAPRGAAGAAAPPPGSPRASGAPGSRPRRGLLVAQARRPQAKDVHGVAPRPWSRVWLAAPSSASWPPPGSGACTTKRLVVGEDGAQHRERGVGLDGAVEHRLAGSPASGGRGRPRCRSTARRWRRSPSTSTTRSTTGAGGARRRAPPTRWSPRRGRRAAEAELPQDAAGSAEAAAAGPPARRRARARSASSPDPASAARARVRHLPLVRRARHVAEGEPGVVVGRPDEAVEVVLAHGRSVAQCPHGRLLERLSRPKAGSAREARRSRGRAPTDSLRRGGAARGGTPRVKG